MLIAGREERESEVNVMLIAGREERVSEVNSMLIAEREERGERGEQYAHSREGGEG